MSSVESTLDPMPADRPLVMVVDDQESQRMLLSAALRGSGFAVATANDGEQALAMFGTLGPVAVVLDVVMPGIDGFEVCRRLRQSPSGRHVPIMMMTGRDDDVAIRAAFDAGATDFVNKPVNRIILGNRMRYMLRGAELQDELRRGQLQLAAAERMARLGSWEWLPSRREMRWSPAMYELLGLSAEIAVPGIDLMLSGLAPGPRGVLESRLRALQAGSDSFIFEFSVPRAGGRRYLQLRAARAGDDTPLIAGTLQDISEHRETQIRMRRLAYYDSLTGLPNRSLAEEQLRQAVAVAHRGGTRIAVLHVDIDHLKRVNDLSGREAGDLLIREVARRLAAVTAAPQCVQLDSPGGAAADDDAVQGLARLDGDEFLIVLEDVRSTDAVQATVQQVFDTLRDSYLLGSDRHRVTPTIGVCLYPDDAGDSAGLLKNAEAALAEAKQRGGNACQFYSRAIHERQIRKLDIEQRLQGALQRDELLVYFQPKVNARLQQVVGMEALVRWQPAGAEVVSPAEFIPSAEESDLIVAIGEWVLRESCLRVRDWMQRGLPPIEIAVNVSPRQFRHGDLVSTVRRVLADTGLEPRLLTLELTESTLLDDRRGAAEILRSLKALGVRLAIDDFGTGYSSLGYLHEFPIDCLKIDRSFVRSMDERSGGSSLVAAIVRLAQSMSIESVAEGVETQEQFEFLRGIGCDEVQGYLFSRPLPPDEIHQWLVDRISVTRVIGARSAAEAAPPHPPNGV